MSTDPLERQRVDVTASYAELIFWASVGVLVVALGLIFVTGRVITADVTLSGSTLRTVLLSVAVGAVFVSYLIAMLGSAAAGALRRARANR